MATRIQVAQLFTSLVADTSEFAKSLNSASDDAKGWATNLGQTIGKAGLAVVASGAALAAGAVVGLGAAVVKMTLDAAAVQGTVNTFDALVLSIGGDAVQAMEMLRASTRGMVADADLMAASNKFLAMGVAETTEEAAKLAEVSTQLGMAMGEDATASMENFALMMANQSIPRLDSFGISSGAVRTRITELMEATADMSREEAFKIAVMEQSIVTMGKVGEQSDTVAGSMSRIKTTVANVSLGIGQAFLPALQSVLTPIAEIAQKVGPQLIAWAQMAGTWLGEKIPTAMDKIMPPIQRFIDGLGSVATYFKAVLDGGSPLSYYLDNLPGSIQPIVQGLGEFINAIQPLITAFALAFGGDTTALMEGLAFSLDNLFGPERSREIMQVVDKFVEFGTQVSAVVSNVADWVVEFVSWKDVLIALGLAILSVVIPAVASLVISLLPIIAAIAAAVLAVAFLRNVFENDLGGIRTFLEDVVAKMKAAWNTVVEAFEEAGIRDAIAEVWTAFTEAWDIIQPILADLWQTVKDVFAEIKKVFGGADKEPVKFADVMKKVAGFVVGAVTGFARIVTKVVKALAAFWDKHGKAIMNYVVKYYGAVARFISGFVKGIVKFFKWVFDIITKLVQGDWRGAWEDAKKIITDVLDNILKKVKDIWDSIKKWIDDALHDILKKVQGVWDDIKKWIEDTLDDILKKVKDIWDDIKKWIEDTLDDILDAVESIWADILKWIEDTLDDILDAVESIWADIQEWIEDALDNILSAVEEIWQDVYDSIAGFLSDIYDEVESIWQDVYDSIADFLSDIFDEVENIWQDVYDAISGFLSDILEEVETIWQDIYDAVSGFLDDIFSEVETIWQDIYDAVSGFLDDIFSEVETVWKDVYDSIAGFLSDIYDEIESIWQDALDEIGRVLGDIEETTATAFQNVYDTVKEKLESLAGIPADIYETLQGIGTEVIDWIVSGINAVTDFVSRVASQLSSWFSSLVDPEADWITNAKSIGSAIIEYIVTGLVAVEDFVSQVAGQLSSWLSSLTSTVTDWLDNAWDIGTKIINKILAGFGSLKDSFIEWIKGKLTDWLGDIFSPVPAAQHMGQTIAEQILFGFGRQRNAFISGMQSELGDWIGGVGGFTVPITASGGLTGLGAGGGMGGANYNPTFHTTVNTPMDWNEFVFMVQEAMREM